MFYVLQNESTASLRNIPILLTDAATGTTAMAGVNTASIYPYVAINGGAFIGGTGPVYESGFGQYVYQMHPAETATLGLAGIHITAAACRDYDAIAQIAALNVYSASVGASAYDVWSFDYSTYPILPVSAAERLEETRTAAYGADNNTTDIAEQVWSNDLASGAFSPYAAGTAGTILYELGQGGAGGGISAADVWNYDFNVNIPIADTYGFQLANQIPSDISGVPGATVSTVWNENAASYTTPGTMGDYVNQLGTGATGYAGTSITAGDVWSYASRTITGGIADTVTDVTNGVIVTTNNDKTGYALSSTQTFDLTGNITGNLSGSVGSVTSDVNVSTASMAGIANTVWSTLTAPYTTHATFGHQILRSDNAATIGEVTLHQSGGSKRVDADVHAFVNNTASATAMLNILTGIGASITGNITGNLSGSVGSVTADVNVSTASMSGIANTVWSTDISVYTAPQAGAIVTDTQTDTNTIITDIGNIPNNVWVSDVSGYVNPGEAGYELTQAASGGAGISAYDVWNFVLSNTDTAEVNLVAASAGGGITAGEVANAVWNAQLATYATPATGEVFSTDTYGTKIARTIVQNRPAAIDTSQRITSVVAALNANVITATSIQSAAITSAKFATDAITSTVIAADAITSAELAPSANTEIADAVWAYATRNITGGTITTVSDKTGYSLSGSQTFDVTGNITGNLSGSVGSVTTVSSGAISAASFLAGAVDAAAVANDAVVEIAGGVWSYVTRDITGGTITTVSDKTGYSLSGTQSFNLTGNITGNLSGSVGSVSGAVGSVTGSVGSVTGSVGSVVSAVALSSATQASIANSVWLTDVSSYTSPSAGYSLAVAGSGGVSAADVWNYNGGRTITGGTATTVTNPVLVDTASMTGIAGTVWTYGSRTLTSGAAITAGDVWTYNISGITTAGTAGKKLNDAASGVSTIQIINGPYRLTSTAEGTDGRLDILQDSVQTIELQLIDSFGSPINIGGNYTLSVDVYDESGALTVSYVPTVAYAGAGLLNFDLDTDVTGVLGRYTIVVSLTDGDVIQVGPLQVLVRPL